MLSLFMARVRELIASDNESLRMQLEGEVLDLAVPLHDAGVFQVLRIADPGLANMVADHLADCSLRGAEARSAS